MYANVNNNKFINSVVCCVCFSCQFATRPIGYRKQSSSCELPSVAVRRRWVEFKCYSPLRTAHSTSDCEDWSSSAPPGKTLLSRSCGEKWGNLWATWYRFEYETNKQTNKHWKTHSRVTDLPLHATQRLARWCEVYLHVCRRSDAAQASWQR